MPETITRHERLNAILSLLPPRKIIGGQPQPYNSKIYNTVLELLDIVRSDMTVIHGLNTRCATLRAMTQGGVKFPALPALPNPISLCLDERAHTLLNLAWSACVGCGHAHLARAIQDYLSAPPEVFPEQPA